MPSNYSQPSKARPQRMAELACLPVFFTLTSKRTIIAGGTDAAAWKAELLAAAGATVEVWCSSEALDDEMAALIGEGRVVHRNATWRSAEFAGAALAIGDVNDAEAAEFVARARRAAVPVNVIDKPEFCEFQFGTIVNRSPVVVGISTNGAAPILGQAIRRRIETVLPATLKAWAVRARDVRDRVMDTLGAGAPRRAFWERFAERAFSGVAPGSTTFEDLASRPVPQGRVTLVGAGPGDAEYLTIKAVRAMQSADVILFDDLVSQEVLELARREAKRMLVGKRGGRESCRQEDINAQMLMFARQGKHVVRLKSGDPMIFGRAGEEIAALDAAGIPVEIVPGITSASALASRAGLSLTHRDHAQSVRFVTGHSQRGGLPGSLDWRSLADASTSTVFYMCRNTLPEIAEKLVSNGMLPQTPILLAANLGRPDEKLYRGVLASAVTLAQQFTLDDVCLMAVGNAFGARAAALADLAPDASRIASGRVGSPPIAIAS